MQIETNLHLNQPLLLTLDRCHLGTRRTSPTRSRGSIGKNYARSSGLVELELDLELDLVGSGLGTGLGIVIHCNWTWSWTSISNEIWILVLGKVHILLGPPGNIFIGLGFLDIRSPKIWTFGLLDFGPRLGRLGDFLLDLDFGPQNLDIVQICEQVQFGHKSKKLGLLPVWST